MPAANPNQQQSVARGPATIPLTREEISEHVRTHISEWLAEQSIANTRPAPVYEIELRERMIRLEEELKSQRELMKQGFDLMEKRFESIDKHFESMDRRFESMDRRFKTMLQENNRRFEALSAENNENFKILIGRMDRIIFWSVGITMGTGSLVVGALKLLL